MRCSRKSWKEERIRRSCPAELSNGRRALSRAVVGLQEGRAFDGRKEASPPAGDGRSPPPQNQLRSTREPPNRRRARGAAGNPRKTCLRHAPLPNCRSTTAASSSAFQGGAGAAPLQG